MNRSAADRGHASFALISAALLGSAFLLTLVARSGEDLARIRLRAAADLAVQRGAQTQSAAADFVAAANLLSLGLHAATAGLLLGGTGTAIAWMTAGAVPAGIDTLAQTADLAGDLLAAHHDLRRAVDTIAFSALPDLVVPAMLSTGDGPFWPLDPLSDAASSPPATDDACAPSGAAPPRRPFGLDLHRGTLPPLTKLGDGAVPSASGADATARMAAATALKLAWAEFVDTEAADRRAQDLPQHRLCELQLGGARTVDAWRREAQRVVAEIGRRSHFRSPAWTPSRALADAWNTWRGLVPTAPAAIQSLVESPSPVPPRPDREPLRGLINTLTEGAVFFERATTCDDIAAHLELLRATWQDGVEVLPGVAAFAGAVDRAGGIAAGPVARDAELSTWLRPALCRLMGAAADLAGSAAPAAPLRLGPNWRSVGVGVLATDPHAGSALAQARPHHPDFGAGELPLWPGFRAVPTPVTVHRNRWPSPWQETLDAGLAH